MRLNISTTHLTTFINDLWKDYRVLELSEEEGLTVIKRYSDKQTEISEEYELLNLLQAYAPFKMPRIVSYSDGYISFQYIAGTRAFNLLNDLKRLYNETTNSKFLNCAEKLLGLLREDLGGFQKIFSDEKLTSGNHKSYPAKEKLLGLYRLLFSIFELPFEEEVEEELNRIAAIYLSAVELPFRDATTKNTILLIPSLYQDRFQTYPKRLDFIFRMVQSGELISYLSHDIVYHIDFSGSLFLCPKTDDWIALNHHEGSDWLTSGQEQIEKNIDIETLCTYFVRFSRFGGRKLAYRILNRDGHRIRFGFDNETHYFKRLIKISRQLRKEGVLQSDTLVDSLQKLIGFCKVQPEQDYLLGFIDSRDLHPYYSDVFPN